MKFFARYLIFTLVILPAITRAFTFSGSLSGDSSIAAASVNELGVDLLHATARPEANALISPYSIETALVMTYAGADGVTRDEMAKVLHLMPVESVVNGSFAKLQQALDAVMQRSLERVEQQKKYGSSNDPVVLTVANRLFGQEGYDFRPTFLDLLKTNYNAPLQAMDFIHKAPAATTAINDWVAQQTKQRIRDLIPSEALDRSTRLVLVNALYMKAPWAEPFSTSETKPLPFHAGAAAANVPTMGLQKSFGYLKTNGVTVVTIPYSGGDIYFLVILPDDVNGMAKVEAGLTAAQLAEWARAPNRPVRLYLPKFKIEPPTLPLGEALQMLGMTTAFDKPQGSANFDRMAPRRPNDYLYISRVFHKTFLSLDEKGTEAAAATAVAMARSSAIMRPIEPVEVKVDHPFIFAIQHRESGACLFLGHVANPQMTYLSK